MGNVVNTKCPYCGSEDIRADCNLITIGKLCADGTIKFDTEWFRDEIEEYVSESDEKHISGYCYHCGSRCKFAWGKGFVKEIPKIRADQIRTLSDENLGRFICKEFMHGACGSCRFDVHVTVPIDKHICTLQEWLKEKSNE